MEGQRFHRLLVLKRVENPSGKKNTRSYWLCRCDCGKEKITTAATLRKIRSCGCFKKEQRIEYSRDKHPNWKGGRHLRGGYVAILARNHPNARPSGYILEHVYVMSNYLGRALKKGETVHHKNGVRTDNRIENLELWSHNHSPGQRISEKIEWCVNFLKEYAPHLLKN